MRCRCVSLLAGFLLLVACAEDAGPIDRPDPPVEDLYRSVVRQVCQQAVGVGHGCPDEVAISQTFSGGPVSTNVRVPNHVRAAILKEAPRAQFVDIEEWDWAGGIVLLIGPMSQTDKGALAIEAGYLCGNLCGSGTLYYFVWDGAAWVEATAIEAGEEFETMWAS